jgi:hypothetical protein
MVATKRSAETPTERKLRREALLKYGPIFAPALRFPFDEPLEESDEPEILLPKVAGLDR